ncbi:hypothetical protein [Saccharopolyspora gregorii]
MSAFQPKRCRQESTIDCSCCRSRQPDSAGSTADSAVPGTSSSAASSS